MIIKDDPTAELGKYWKVKYGKLVLEIENEDFMQSIKQVDRIAKVAQEMDHHPDLFIHDYKYLTVSLVSHKEGGITSKDTKLAKEINKIIGSH